MFRPSSVLASLVLAAFFSSLASAAVAQAVVTIRVCNESRWDALVASSYMPRGDSRWLNRGWTRVNRGACRVIGETTNANFYLYADRVGTSGYWGGRDNLCVEYPGPYSFYNVGSMTCSRSQTSVPFRRVHVSSGGTYTWRLVN